MTNEGQMWRCFSGFVQWDPKEVDVKGKSARWVSIKALGLAGVEIRLTLWPEFSDVDVNKGDYVAVEGLYEQRDSGGNTYHNLSVKRLVVNPSHESGTAQKAPAKKKSSKDTQVDMLEDLL